MRFPSATVVVLAVVSGWPVMAKDRDREDFFEAPQRNPEADRLRSETDQAYQRGDYRKVVELASSLLASFPEDNPHVALHLRASAQIEIGRQARSAKQIREGIADARLAIGREGLKHAWLYIPYLYGLSSLAEVEKRPEHAEMAVKAATPVIDRPVGADFSNDDRANLLYQRAVAQTARRDLKAAAADYREAIRANQQHLGASVKLGEVLAAQGATKEALAAYDDAVRRFPSTLLVYNDRGNFRRSIGDLDGAISDFSRSLQLDPKFTVGFVNRGMCLADQNQPQAAEGDFSEALKLRLEPGMQILALRLRALARVSQGNSEGAQADYAAALRLAPSEPTLFEELGFVRFFRQEHARAAADFAKALQLNRELVRIIPWHSLALARAGKSAEARGALVDSELLQSPANRWVAAAVAYLADRSTEEELLTAAADLEPQSAAKQRLCEARFFIGQKKLLVSDADSAKEQFREAVATDAFLLSAFRGARYELGEFPAR